MKLGLRRMILGVIGTVLACFLSVAPASGQTPPEQKPAMVEDAFKNIHPRPSKPELSTLLRL